MENLWKRSGMVAKRGKTQVYRERKKYFLALWHGIFFLGSTKDFSIVGTTPFCLSLWKSLFSNSWL